MHEVRIYRNRHAGTTWWAKDDLGFAGGADVLSDLIPMIEEWARCEGIIDHLHLTYCTS